MDHRLGERLALDRVVRVQLPHGAGSMAGRITDVSRSGAFIADCSLPLYTLIHVHIAPDPPRTWPESVVVAYVARTCAEGVGVEWCEFAPAVVVTTLLQPLLVSPLWRGSLTRSVESQSTSG